MCESVTEPEFKSPDKAELRSMVASLYQQYRAYLIKLAQRFGCVPDFAEDLVHETFLVAMKKADALYHAENRIAWLTLVLKRRVAALLRAIAYKQQLQMNLQAEYSGTSEDQIGLDILYAGLIGEDDLNLLIEHYVIRYPIVLMADRMSISVEACKKRIQRARARMSAAYAAYIENRNRGN